MISDIHFLFFALQGYILCKILWWEGEGVEENKNDDLGGQMKKEKEKLRKNT